MGYFINIMRKGIDNAVSGSGTLLFIIQTEKFCSVATLCKQFFWLILMHEG